MLVLKILHLYTLHNNQWKERASMEHLLNKQLKFISFLCLQIVKRVLNCVNYLFILTSKLCMTKDLCE